MMMSELERLVETITREKNIPRDVVVEILESAVEAAARKKYGMALDIEAQYNDEIGEVELFKFVRVVDEVEDDLIEIHIEEARELDEDCEVGDDLGIKMEPEAEKPKVDVGAIADAADLKRRIEEARKGMLAAAEALDFERAATLRDQLLALEKMQLAVG